VSITSEENTLAPVAVNQIIISLLFVDDSWVTYCELFTKGINQNCNIVMHGIGKATVIKLK
jgi:hypothetical protein